LEGQATTWHLKGIDMYLYGASGHCKVIIDLIKESNQLKLKGYLTITQIGGNFRYTGIKHKEEHSCTDKQIIVSIGDNRIRKRITEKINANYTTAIHPNAIISIYSNIDIGTVVMAGAIINPDVAIGNIAYKHRINH